MVEIENGDKSCFRGSFVRHWSLNVFRFLGSFDPVKEKDGKN